MKKITKTLCSALFLSSVLVSCGYSKISTAEAKEMLATNLAKNADYTLAIVSTEYTKVDINIPQQLLNYLDFTRQQFLERLHYDPKIPKKGDRITKEISAPELDQYRLNIEDITRFGADSTYYISGDKMKVAFEENEIKSDKVTFSPKVIEINEYGYITFVKQGKETEMDFVGIGSFFVKTQEKITIHYKR